MNDSATPTMTQQRNCLHAFQVAAPPPVPHPLRRASDRGRPHFASASTAWQMASETNRRMSLTAVRPTWPSSPHFTFRHMFRICLAEESQSHRRGGCVMYIKEWGSPTDVSSPITSRECRTSLSRERASKQLSRSLAVVECLPTPINAKGPSK